MGLSEVFKGKSVLIDTAPIIYFIEGNSKFRLVLRELFEAVDQGEIHLHTSIITLTEVLVRPYQQQRMDIAAQYEKILCQASSLEIHDLDVKTGIMAARIRAEKKLKTPDAFQIAAAMRCRADFFLTNDKALSSIRELNIVCLDDHI